MIFFELLRLGFRNLTRRKIRTALTILGISIGIASIILFISIGEGMKNIVFASFGDVGNDLVVLPRFDPSSGKPNALTYEDLQEIEKVGGVRVALPRLTEFSNLNYKKHSIPTSIIGVDPNKEIKEGVELASGRFLRSSDKHVVVLGSSRAKLRTSKTMEKKTYRQRKDISPQTIENPEELSIDLGKSIMFKFNEGEEVEKRFRVVGILADRGMSGEVFLNPDDAIIMPIDTLRKLTGADKQEITQIVVKLDDPSQAEQIIQEIREKTNTNVMSLEKILGAMSSFFKIIEVIFFAIGSISLVVSGFGIMNTMLMAVLERTREVGVLKSIGAARSHVLRVFLVESALIGFLGGLTGTFVGTTLSKTMNFIGKQVLQSYFHMAAENIATMPPLMSVPSWLSVFAIFFGTFISIVFGLYPAIRASELSPVEALRYT